MAVVNRVDTADSGLDKAVGISQIGATAIALAALLGLLWQARRTRRDARQDRAIAFQGRYTSGEFRRLGSMANAFLDAADARDCVLKLQSWYATKWANEEALLRSPRLTVARPSRNQVMELLDFFEALGVLYNGKALNHKVILDGFATPPVQMFTTAWWFICWLRDGKVLGETTVYDQFEKMTHDIRRRRPDVHAEFKPNRESGVLCLPAGGVRPTPHAWARCAAMSEALSRRVVRATGDDAKVFGRVLHGLLCEVDGIASHGTAGAPLEVSLLAVPRDIQVKPELWNPVRHEAACAGKRLSKLGAARFDELIGALGGTIPAARP